METSVKSKNLEAFRTAANTIVNPELQKWMDKGGKVMGYWCCYAPEEIITAAGMAPIRVRATGSTGTELADAYVSSINCSFCRHAFNMGLNGEYDFVEAMVWLNNCDHVRRMYDNWWRKVSTPLTRMMSLPKFTGDKQVAWWREELVFFKEGLEKHLGITITDDKLREAINIHNEKRRLLRQLFELRKSDNPPITGADSLAAVVASTSIPPAEFNQMLKDLLEELKDAEGIKDYSKRLLLVGSIFDDPSYVKNMEDIGALVVADNQCFGTRAFAVDVNESIKDPLDALAKHTIQDRQHCPRLFGEYKRRSQYVQDMVKDYKVDGVVGLRMTFCDLWAGEYYMLNLDMKKAGIPFFYMDREYLMGGTAGQIRTRIQAFMETL